MKLWIGEMRPARINPDGTPCGVAMKYEPAPQSRYLSKDPGMRRRHVEAFRQTEDGGLAPGARAAVAAAAVPPPGVGGGGGGGGDVDGGACSTVGGVGAAAAAAWLRQLQEQQEQGPALAATAATAAGAAQPMASAGLMPVPQSAPEVHAQAHGPAPLPVAASPAGLPHSPFLLGEGQPAAPLPLGYHPLEGPPDLDLEYLEAIFDDEDGAD